MSENTKRDLEIKAFYLAGGSRASAMEKWSLKTNQMAGVSTRLNMYWSWPIENRRSGIQPIQRMPQAPSALPSKPRYGDRGGGTIHSIKARESNTSDTAKPVAQVPSDAPLYEAGSMRRQYGRPVGVSTRQRRERGLQDDDFNIGGAHSPYPEPTKDCPFETIAYIARHWYEGKPIKT